MLRTLSDQQKLKTSDATFAIAHIPTSAAFALQKSSRLQHASNCQFAVHTPRILCWNKQKLKKLIPVASRYFILRRRHSTAVADFPTTIHGLHFTIRFDKNVPSLSATFHSSQSKVDTSKFTAIKIPSKTSLTLPNQPTRCTDANLQLISSQH